MCILLFWVAVVIAGIAFVASSSQNYEGLVDVYIRNNHTHFQNCSPDFKNYMFSNDISIKDLGNNEHQVNGTLKDNGGWTHTVSAIIQTSPNSSKFLMCSLYIDGTKYVSNDVEFDVLAYSNSAQIDSSYNAESIMSLKNTGQVIITGFKIEMVCSSPNIIVTTDGFTTYNIN